MKLSNNRYFIDIPTSLLSKFFSTRVLKELAQENGGKYFANLLMQVNLKKSLLNKLKIGDFYEEALEALSFQEKNEYVYKNVLARKLLLGKHSLNTASMFFEFRAGDSKLDALMINGSSHAYEIKTELDELKRLPHQLLDYQKRFEHVWVLTNDRHVAGIEAIAAKDIGISVLNKKGQISIIREARKQHAYLDSIAIMSSLRRHEYTNIVKSLGFDVIGIPNTQIYTAASSFIAGVNPVKVHDLMKRELKIRFWDKQAKIARVLPGPLTAVSLGLNITEQQALVLSRNLEVRIKTMVEK